MDNNNNSNLNKNIKLENIIVARFVEDHMLILENMEFAVFALEN